MPCSNILLNVAALVLTVDTCIVAIILISPHEIVCRKKYIDLMLPTLILKRPSLFRAQNIEISEQTPPKEFSSKWLRF